MGLRLSLLLLLLLLVPYPKTYTTYIPMIQRPECPDGRGVAGLIIEPQAINELCISWWHDWSINDRTGVPGEYVPMFWGEFWPTDGPPVVYYMELAKEELGAEYCGFLLFLNEPDLPPPQSNLTALRAAELYLELREELPCAKLIGPQVSDIGLSWLVDWRESVYVLSGEYPTIYAYSMHADSIEDLDALCGLIISWGEVCEGLWITEFGTGCDVGELYSLTAALSLDARVARYAVYSILPTVYVGCNSVYDNGITPYGQAFLGYYFVP